MTDPRDSAAGQEPIYLLLRRGGRNTYFWLYRPRRVLENMIFLGHWGRPENIRGSIQFYARQYSCAVIYRVKEKS